MDLGDKRRNRHLINLVNELSQDTQGSISQVCEGWAETKAAYRLLSNDALDCSELLRSHSVPTLKRCEDHPVVLRVQETTELGFSSQPGCGHGAVK